MTQQTTIFDAIAGEQLKQAGIARATKDNPGFILASQIAVELGKRYEAISSDTVYYEWKRRFGETMPWIGNAAGGLFRGKGWEWAGNTKSTRPNAHKNSLNLWSLKR